MYVNSTNILTNYYLEKQKHMSKDNEKIVTLKNLNKGNVWDIQENDIIRMIETAQKDSELKENMNHYFTIMRTAFDIEEVKSERKEVEKKYVERGFKIGKIKVDSETVLKWAVKKRPIQHVTDLTYENIFHISAQKLIEVLDRNFGGGWDSLPQSVKDIIQHGFDISTTTLPADRLHKAGSLYDKKVKDGYEVLEIAKGTWVEAIFAKAKPKPEKKRMTLDADPTSKLLDDDDRDEDLEDEELVDNNALDDDDDDTLDEDQLTEESYRTTFDTDPEDLNIEAEDMADDDSF